MRHRVDHRKLRRSSEHRWSMLRNLVTSLVEHERVETTLEKGKEVRRLADRMITLGKQGDLAARRSALRVLKSAEETQKLFSDLAKRFQGRSGGYTRIVRLGRRLGDGARMCVLEWVGSAGEAPAQAPRKRPKPAPKAQAAS